MSRRFAAWETSNDARQLTPVIAARRRRQRVKITHISRTYVRALSVKSKIMASVKWSATPIMAEGDKINEFRKNSQPIEFSIFAFRIWENSFFNLITAGICSVHVLADLLDICRSRCFPYLHFLDRLIMM